MRRYDTLTTEPTVVTTHFMTVLKLDSFPLRAGHSKFADRKHELNSGTQVNIN